MKNLIWKPVKAVDLTDLTMDAKIGIAQQITDNWNTWKTNRFGLEQCWAQIDRQVEQYDPYYTNRGSEGQGGPTLQVPSLTTPKVKMGHAYAHREGITASMMQYLMQNDYDFFELVPLDSLDEEKTLAAKQYMMWVLDIMDFETGLTKFIRDAVQYGTAVASLEWVKETVPVWRTSTITDPITGIPAEVTYEAQETIYDAPKFTPLDIYYVVVDPTAPNLKTANLIQKVAITPHELMANEDYAHIGWDVASEGETFTLDGNNLTLEKEHAQGNSTFSPTVYRDKKQVFEAWGDFTYGRDTFKNYKAVVYNGNLIYFKPNQYSISHKPFVIARYAPQTNRLYGHSPVGAITGLQVAFDSLLNQAIDLQKMELERPVLIEPSSLVQTQRGQAPSIPPMGKDIYWFVRDADRVQRMKSDAGRALPPTDPLLQRLESQMKNVTGDNELLSGGSANPYMKTGVAVTVANAGTAKMNMYAKSIEKEGIIPALELILDLLREHLKEPVTMKRKDDASFQSITLDPTDLLSDIRFTMRGASYNMNKQLNISNLTQFFQGFFANPYTAMVLNPVEAVRVMAESLGIRGIPRLLSPQAQQMADTVPKLAFMDQVKKFFGLEPQQPGNMEAPPSGNQSLGNQYTQQYSAGFGGTAEGQPSSFNFTQPR